MNKQQKSVTKRGIEWTDFTWNVIGGCKHRCRWEMPDGSVAICYAEEVANALRSDKFYPQGFENHYYHPDRLTEPLKVKTPAKIFLDSMSDLMGHWVPDEQIEAVLDIARKAHWHTFQLLTKNTPRLKHFDFPDNVWVGVSAPPSSMFGSPLSLKQQRAMVYRQLDILNEVKAKVRWMSIEPMAFDIASVFTEWLDVRQNGCGAIFLPLEWAVIGAASNGSTYYQPDPSHVSSLLSLLTTPVFFKGNMKANPAATPWREEFPAA